MVSRERSSFGFGAFDVSDMRRSLKGFLIGLAGLVLYGVLLSLLVHFERASEDSNIHTLRDAVWYSMVTLTTVGYGDMYPQTTGGRAVGYIFVLASLGVLGFLIGKVNAFFGAMAENKRLGYHGTSFQEHVVIIGWNSFAQTVAEQMLTAGVRVAVVTESRDQVDLIAEAYNKSQVFTLYSSFTSMDVIEKANLEESTAVFINLEDDAQTLVFLLNCRKHFGEYVQFGVVLDSGELKSTFEKAGASIVVCKNDLCSKLVASYIFEPQVARFTEDLIASAVGHDDFDIQQFYVTGSNPVRGKSYEAAFFELKKSYDALLIGLTTRRNGVRVLHKTPDDPSLNVAEGDYLILIVSGQNVERLTESFGVTEGYHKTLEQAAPVAV